MSKSNRKMVRKMAHISLSQMESFIEDTYAHGGNALFLSEPGIGKTGLSKQVAMRLLKENLTKDQLEGAFQIIDGSGMGEETLFMPYVDITQAGKENPQVLQKDLIPELKAILSWMEKHPYDPNDDKTKGNKNTRMILFIDELTSFEQGTDQRTLLNLIQEGRMPDGQKFDKNRLVVILAGNPSTSMPGYENYDGATNDVESAVITRMATFFVEPLLKDFLEWGSQFDEETGLQNIHPYIQSALKTDPNMFMAMPEGDIRVCNPRTLNKLSDYFYSQSRRNKKWDKAYVAALISDEVGASMSNIIDNLDRLVGIHELFGSDKTNKINTEALAKFKGLEEFEKYYIISTALNGGENEIINFGIKNNVIKLLDLLQNGDVPPETLVSFGTALVSAEKRGVKSKLIQAKWLDSKETNIMGYLRSARQLTNMIN